MVRGTAAGYWATSAVVAALAVGCGAGETVTDTPIGTYPPMCPALVLDTTTPLAAPPDGAASCAAGECNYQTQDGCSSAQACRPQFSADAPDVHPGCEPAGAATAGEPCAAQGDCARGHFCAEGVCRKLCCGGDWTGCDASERCFRALQVKAGGQVIDSGAQLCFPVGTCDPLDPKSCANEPGRECKIVDPTGAVACAPQSSAKLGDPCAPPDVCSQGLTCVGSRCVKLCAYEACKEPSCSRGEGSCVSFGRDPFGVGECTFDR
ncbi:MAG: hypothetical protein EOO73_08215 [Myxococcales bacterium]|nr:MAG: hypothetical protein EOO73_08215 [Myxococcales bacterium]